MSRKNQEEKSAADLYAESEFPVIRALLKGTVKSSEGKDEATKKRWKRTRKIIFWKMIHYT